MNVRRANIVVIAGGMSFPPSTRAPQGRKSQAQDDSTLGGRLFGLRSRAGMTQDDLADVLGVSRTQVSKYERDEAMVPDPVIMRAALRFSVTPAWIRYGDTEGRMTRVIGSVGAGGHVEAIAFEDGRQVEIPASWSDAVALQVDGLSCWPTYDNGDIIIVRGEQRLTELSVPEPHVRGRDGRRAGPGQTRSARQPAGPLHPGKHQRSADRGREPVQRPPGADAPLGLGERSPPQARPQWLTAGDEAAACPAGDGSARGQSSPAVLNSTV